MEYIFTLKYQLGGDVGTWTPSSSAWAMEYIFTLKYQLGAMSRTWTPSSSAWAKPVATTRWRAGLALEFTREAPSAEVAVGSA